ncbi:ABC-type phosphate/phosphonate transport system substrate-binding protein [Sphingomonas zeicaulis]|uniref:phosphate/phosphite/phosphonate ABC transporter substrate-binding protein n=1 Tax=Sphingomonas zeicaulis TaxID=1632740 RepID=UPI003D206717
MALIANARMYAVNPGAAAAWKALFAWVLHKSGVALEAIDHAYPARLSALWERPDLGCGFVCGLPFLLRDDGLQPLAAPVPRGAGGPVYATHFLVRRDHPAQRLEDLAGGRIGYTADDSQSGLGAPRHHLMGLRGEGQPLFAEAIGPLVTPRRVVEALAEERIDVGPLDSFAWALIARHEPDLAAGFRIIASTDPTPMPFLAAAGGVDAETVSRLRAALLDFDDPAIADALCLAGFAPVDVAAYDVITRRWHAAAAEPLSR